MPTKVREENHCLSFSLGEAEHEEEKSGGEKYREETRR
jgi:hypothetical protein